MSSKFLGSTWTRADLEQTLPFQSRPASWISFTYQRNREGKEKREGEAHGDREVRARRDREEREEREKEGRRKEECQQGGERRAETAQRKGRGQEEDMVQEGVSARDGEGGAGLSTPTWSCLVSAFPVP